MKCAVSYDLDRNQDCSSNQQSHVRGKVKMNYNATTFDIYKEEMGLYTANSKGVDLIASK